MNNNLNSEGIGSVANELLLSTEELFTKCYNLMEKKNIDYSGEDCFDNFFLSESLSGVPVEKGILVRLGDKFSRIKNLLDKLNIVEDESIYDTIEDLINYSAILYSLLKHKENVNKDKITQSSM